MTPVGCLDGSYHLMLVSVSLMLLHGDFLRAFEVLLVCVRLFGVALTSRCSLDGAIKSWAGMHRYGGLLTHGHKLCIDQGWGC